MLSSVDKSRRPEQLEQVCAAAGRYRRGSNIPPGLAVGQLNVVEVLHNGGLEEDHQVDLASFQVPSVREGKDESRLIAVLAPHMMDGGTQASQIASNTGAHEGYRVVEAGTVAVGTRQEILQVRKHCLDDCRRSPEDR